MYFATEGVILARKNFGEADRLLTIYTKDHGKISAIAKGVRRPRSKKAGHLELGNWCKVFVAKGKNIDLLTEVEVKRAFGIAEFGEKKANKIYHLLEIVDILTPHNQKNLRVFSLLVSFLKKTSNGEDFNLVSSAFKTKLLSALGFFSSHNLKDSKAKDVLLVLENEDFSVVAGKLNLTDSSYLKLLSFLDSMIESIAGQKLKTARFLT
ncbi:MAG: DNA repair protein RecO [Candidatus Curtissbacteria bacterium]|nr:DNA repair protein RecO [Candidatus Curtissbacteria bacterium]